MKHIPKTTSLFALIGVIAFAIPMDDALASSEMSLETDNTIFEPTSRIFVSGTLESNDKFYEPVLISVTDASGMPLIYSQAYVDENNAFYALITGPLGYFEEGAYTIDATHPSSEIPASISIEVVDEFAQHTIRTMNMTPFDQLQAGIAPTNVICDQGHVLVKNIHDGDVACVTPSTAIALEERKWGYFI